MLIEENALNEIVRYVEGFKQQGVILVGMMGLKGARNGRAFPLQSRTWIDL